MNKKTSQLIGALFFLAVVLLGAKARAQDVYNLWDEFSTATNSDTSMWSFRYQNANILDSNNIPDNTIRNGVYTLMTSCPALQGQTQQNGWANMTSGLLRWSVGDNSTPFLVKNISGADIIQNSDWVYPSNSVSMKFDTSTLTVLSWLAPRAGTVNVTYEFAAEWTNQGMQVAWYVDHGDQTGNLASGTIADSDTGLQTVTNVAVAAGDRINFLGEPVNSDYTVDYTRVLGRIVYTDATNVVYDDEAQFDATNNTDTNIWSCRYQAYNDGTLNAWDFSDRNGIYTLIPDSWTYYGEESGLAGWIRETDYGNQGAGFPSVIQNQTGAAYAYAGIPVFTIPANGVYVNDDGDTAAVVSWLAPSNGTVSILYEFYAQYQDRYYWPGGDPFNNGTLDYIDKGDSNGNLVSIRIDPNTNESAFLLDTGHQGIYNVAVNAGDRINFVVDPTGRRAQFDASGTTGLFAQVQYYGQTPPTLSVPQQTPPGTLNEGDTVSLSAAVQGSLPMFLQWTRNGQPLAGQTGTNLVLTNITIAADAGTYALIAVNPGATVTSTPVTLNVVLGPPVISQQPASAIRYPNGAVTFSVSAGGTAPIFYQWQYGSTPISGATTSSLTLTGLGAANAGSYDVVVSNPYGTNTSSNAVLTLIGVATNYASAVAALGPTAYWRLNETSGANAYDYMGGYTGTIVGGVTLGQPGPPCPGLDAANTSFGFDGSSGVVETPLLINGFAGTFTALVKAVNPGATYEPGIMIAGGGTGACCGLGLNTDGLTLQYFWDNQGDTSGWSSGLQVTPNTWCFVAASVGQDQTILYVDNGSGGLLSATNSVPSFSVSAAGPLFIGYDATTFSGEPNPYFNGGIDEAAYFDRALAPAEIAALDHTLFSGAPFGAQSIMIQPASQSAFAGSAATFTVSAVGNMPLTFQWQFNSANIPGATGQTLVIPSVDYSSAGSYTVVVSNSVSGSTSQAAQLTVLDPAIMANVTYGLVAHYKFDGDCTDSSGHGHDGFPENSPSYVQGKIGSAIALTTVGNVNSDQYVALGDPADFQFNAGDSFSVALWLNYTGSPGDLPIIGNARGSTYQHGWVLTDGNCDSHPGEIESSLDGANFYDNDTPAVGGGLLNDGNWHHLAMTIDQVNNIVAIYIDGALALGFPAVVGSLNTGYQTMIGSDPTGGYEGCAAGGYTIDDLGIWRRALSAAEVAGIYAAGNSGNSFDTYGPVQLATKLTSTGQLQISWQQGTLESAPALTGPWTAVTGATAPVYVAAPTNSHQFYRVQ